MSTPKSYEKKLAECLAQFREEKGISQEALGVQLGKGQSDIAKIENGSRRIGVVEMLHWMSALDISYQQITDMLEPFYLSIRRK